MFVLKIPAGAAYNAFGTFALLAMADFGGPTKDRARAYLLTGVAGLVTITLGSLLALNPWLAIVGTFASSDRFHIPVNPDRAAHGRQGLFYDSDNERGVPVPEALPVDPH